MTEHRVTLSNRDSAIYTVNGRRPLLEQLRDQGVDLPYGCEYGGCITCAAKLVKGDIDQRRQVALNNRQIEDQIQRQKLNKRLNLILNLTKI